MPTFRWYSCRCVAAWTRPNIWRPVPHNMRGYGGAGERAAAEFDGWLQTTITGTAPAQRAAALRRWEYAPSARAAHPREEHLLPLMVATGAAGDSAGTRVYTDRVWNIATSGFRFG